VRAEQILHRTFASFLGEMHATRMTALFDVVCASLLSSALTLTQLARHLTGPSSIRHKIKRCDRLLDEAATRREVSEIGGFCDNTSPPAHSCRGPFHDSGGVFTMSSDPKVVFDRNYKIHLQKLELHGYRPKTIDAYARTIRRVGEQFDHRVDDLTEGQLLDYFSSLLRSHSWSAVKLDLYGLKFYYEQVLRKPWVAVDLIKPPKSQRLPDILTVEQVAQLINATQVMSYRVFFFTLYSLGLRLGEGLNLKVGDIDRERMRVQVRDAKGRKDRLVTLPDSLLRVLGRFWRLHRNPVYLFPNRAAGREGACCARTPLDRGGVQQAIKRVATECGFKKTSPRTVCATAMQPI
jgi:integrase/recombinase XerD